VLAGNALYFQLFAPRLPKWAQHRPFAVDAGLLFDFAICLVIYLGLGFLVRSGRHSS
jgi:hypothetical protein